MAMLAAALAVAAPMMLADEKSFFHIPGVEDFRIQAISRTGNEEEWPFGVGEGFLLCAYVLGDRVVYFATRPEGNDDGIMPRVIVISTNPFDLLMSSLMARDLIASYESIEQLIVRMAPFETLGRRLCDQPRGSEIGPGEL